MENPNYDSDNEDYRMSNGNKLECIICKANFSPDEPIVHSSRGILCVGCFDENRDKQAYGGFLRPCKVSDTLGNFISKHAHILPQCNTFRLGDYINRNYITQFLTQYILSHNLRSAEDARVILYEEDEEFSNLIDTSQLKNGELTYFSLQLAIKHHFILS